MILIVALIVIGLIFGMLTAMVQLFRQHLGFYKEKLEEAVKEAETNENLHI